MGCGREGVKPSLWRKFHTKRTWHPGAREAFHNWRGDEGSPTRWRSALPGLVATWTTLSLFRESWQAERATSEWGCRLLSSRTLEEGHICSHHQFKILAILKSFFVVVIQIYMWSYLIFLNSWNMFSSWCYNFAKYQFLSSGKKKSDLGSPNGCFITRAFRLGVLYSRAYSLPSCQTIKCPSWGVPDWPLCSCLRSSLLAVIPGIAKSITEPLFNATDLKCFPILEQCQAALLD